MSYHDSLAIDHMKEPRLLWLQPLRPTVSTCVGLKQEQAVVLLCCVSCLSQKQTVPKSKVKRYLTTTVCVFICSDALWIEGCFLLAILFHIFSYSHSGRERRAGTCVLQVDSLVSISLCAVSRGFGAAASNFGANKHSNCLYKYYPKYAMSAPPPPEKRRGELRPGIKMPTLHYGWSTSSQLAAWGWGSDGGQGQSWLSSWLLC